MLNLKSIFPSFLTPPVNLALKSNRLRSCDHSAHVTSAIGLSEQWNCSTQTRLHLQRNEAGPKMNRSPWGTFRRFTKITQSVSPCENNKPPCCKCSKRYYQEASEANRRAPDRKRRLSSIVCELKLIQPSFKTVAI